MKDKLTKIDKENINLLGDTVDIGRNCKTGELITVNDGRSLVPNGIIDEKLVETLNKCESPEQMQSAVSLYLFEKGKESSSFMLDLMASKGQFMQKAHIFQTNMRFDFTMFVGMFSNFLLTTAQSIVEIILPGCDVIDLESRAMQFIKDNKNVTYEVDGKSQKMGLREFLRSESINYNIGTSEYAMVEMAVRFVSEAQTLNEGIQRMAQEREQANGKGILIGKDGKPYNLYKEGVK